MSVFGIVVDTTGGIMGEVDFNGVFTQSAYGEACDEFVANGGPENWRDAEAEAEAREVNPDTDTETDPYGHGEPSADDWEWFLSVSYVDPAERP